MALSKRELHPVSREVLSVSQFAVPSRFLGIAGYRSLAGGAKKAQTRPKSETGEPAWAGFA